MWRWPRMRRNPGWLDAYWCKRKELVHTLFSLCWLWLGPLGWPSLKAAGVAYNEQKAKPDLRTVPQWVHVHRWLLFAQLQGVSFCCLHYSEHWLCLLLLTEKTRLTLWIVSIFGLSLSHLLTTSSMTLITMIEFLATLGSLVTSLGTCVISS